MELWRNDTERANLSTRQETCSNAIFPTTTCNYRTIVRMITNKKDTEFNKIRVSYCPNKSITELMQTKCFTSVDPVKATLLTSGWAVIAAPAVGP
jgi:hypothetical protein